MMVQLLGKETSKMAKAKTPKKVVGIETPKTTPKVLKKDTLVKSAQKISKTPVAQTPKTLKGKSPNLDSTKKIPAMKGIPKSTKESLTPKSAKKSPKGKAAPPPKAVELDEEDDSDVEMSDEEEEITVPAQKKQGVEAVDEDEDDDDEDDDEDEEVMNSDVDDNDDKEDTKMESEEEEDGDDDDDDDKKEVEQEKQSPVKGKASAKDDKSDDRALFITQINFQTKYKDFLNHFKHFGAVTKGFLSSNKNRKGLNLGFGFITYDTDTDKEAALRAVHTLDGRTLSVLVSNKDKEAGKRKREGGDDDGPSSKKSTFEHEIFAGRLSFDSTADDIKEHFSKFGTVCNVVLPLNFHTKKNKGFAFVAFTDKKAQMAALAESDQKLGSRTIAVCPKKADKKEVPKEMREIPQFEHELFVGGLSSVTERQTLDVHFSKYGKVEKVTLPWIQHAKRNKGYAFVAFEKAESVKKALQEDHEIDGSTVNVRHTKDKPAEKTKNENVGKVAAAKPKIEKKVKEEEDDDDDDDDDEEDDDDEDDEAEDGDNAAGEGGDDEDNDEDEDGEEEEEDDDDEEEE